MASKLLTVSQLALLTATLSQPPQLVAMAEESPRTGRSLYTSGADYSSQLSQSSYAANSARAPAAAPERQQPVPGVTASPRAARR